MKTDQLVILRQAAGGFTPAVTPLAATAHHTDQLRSLQTQDIHCGETTIPSQGDELPAYIAKPDQHTGPYPVVIVVQEIFGVHEHIQDICRRLAKQGYLAIAPELYFRQGDAKDYSNINELVNNLVKKVPDRQVLVDLDHTAHWASRHGGDTKKLAITGFCWGGRIAWLYAAHNPQLKAAVAWYGKLVGEKTLFLPKYPVDIAIDLCAPVLGLYGGKDSSITAEHIETMRQALRAANADAEIIVYPEAGHAFNADYRPSYHAESAQDGWQRMLDWFTQHGVSAIPVPEKTQ
ncbi:dienelactone hydrolase family protein [Yersinia wautersii]|uniref:Carboxymethylenebutenolidase n=1 Tax=Yersinia pseudotuberculosis TaxID=633 RepID=A0A380QE31_YERPU|nr:dienelactone hydrolase family protein [Yersinia pseudotuberculosis]SUP86665.1 carboxymethylenebutenolidase [Yersinia pseudotuberculosis]